jgi:hypothetical protein
MEVVMTQSASGAWEGQDQGQWRSHRSCSWGKGGRSRWSLWDIGTIVGGFMVFWPVGLIALFLKVKNGELWQGSAEGRAPWAAWKGAESWRVSDMWRSAEDKARRWRDEYKSDSGNWAFEEYKKQELAKLDEMRRRLEDEQKAFAEFTERVRRAKDKEEFDRFIAERRTPPPTVDGPNQPQQ